MGINYDGCMVINPETAEVITTMNEYNFIGSQKKVDNYRELNQDTITLPKCKGFVKLNIEEINQLNPTLSNMESVVFMKIIPYISYKNCCLMFSNGRDIGLKELIKITGLSENTVYAAVEGLISKDVLFKGRNSRNNQYYVNPWLANKGMIVNKVLKNMFKNYKIHTMGGRKWSELPDEVSNGR